MLSPTSDQSSPLNKKFEQPTRRTIAETIETTFHLSFPLAAEKVFPHIIILLAETLKIPSHEILLQKNRLLSRQEHSLVKRRLTALQQGLPLGYILAETPFCSLKLHTPQGVFLPRPETEDWTMQVITKLSSLINKASLKKSKISVLDIGTGSGAIALALKKKYPELDVYALDASPKAIALAKENARMLLPREHHITFVPMTLFTTEHCKQRPLDLAPPLKRRYHLIVSNPPYIAENDIEVHTATRQFEPYKALYSGTDGMDFLRHLKKLLPQILHNHGLFYFEFGHRQGNAVQKLFQSFHNVRLHKDFLGKDRFISGGYHFPSAGSKKA